MSKVVVNSNGEHVPVIHLDDDGLEEAPLSPRSVTSHPYGAGKKVYIQDKQYAWLPATLVESDPLNDRVKVRIDVPSNWKNTTITSNKETYALAKKEVWIDLADYRDCKLPLRQSTDATVRDVAELSHLHEASILYLLKDRHVHQKPYTRVGEIIVAVNPCQWIEDLYSIDQQRLYAKRFVWQGM